VKECNQCGKCCIKYSNGQLSASSAEIEYWEVFRPEIAKYVRDGKIWMDPVSGEQIERCPWLNKLSSDNKYGCAIYHDRPNDCQYYPVTINEMIADECEMFEDKDRNNLTQAQNSLDTLMSDSRPALE